MILLAGFTAHRFEVWRLQRQQLKLNTNLALEQVKQAKAETDRRELSKYVLHFDSNQRLLVPRDYAHSVTIIEPSHPAHAATTPLLDAPEPPPLNFLELLPRLQTVLIVGAQNAGKTTLLHIVAHHRLQVGVVVALDPHSQRWPAGVTVVGVGRDYASIGAILDKLAELLDIRYKRQQAGKLITVVCDEWLSIIDNVPEAADRLKLLLTEGRKVNIHLFLGSHTDRARQLGLTGLADLRDGMSIIYLNWNPRTDARTAEIVLNNERLPIITPPPVAVVQAQVLRVAPPAAKPKQKVCPVCGGDVSENATYCSNACKQKAYRQRVTL